MVSSAPEASEVVMGPQAFCSMVLHAVQHPTTVVHGLLLGSFDSKSSKITVQDAVPVCHGTPTLPVIETSIGLLEVQLTAGTSIVGWYTAPMHLDDVKPGPVALRMATNLETETTPSTLIVLNNKELASCLKGGKESAAVQAYGKDFGKQFQEAIKTTVTKGASSALVAAQKEGLICSDMEDNMEDTSKVWYPNEKLGQIIKSSS